MEKRKGGIIMKKYKLSELLERDAIVIHTPEKKQEEKLFKVLDEKGYVWTNGVRLTSSSEWKYYEDQTCYVIYKRKKVFFYWLDLERYPETIEFKDIDFGNDDTLKKANRLYLMSGITTIVSVISIIASLFIFIDEKIREFAYIPILITFTLLFIGIHFDGLSRNNYDKAHDEEIKNLKLGYEKELADEKKKLNAVHDYSLKLERKIEALRDYKAIYIDKSITSDGVPSKESLLKDIGDDINLLTPPTLTEDKGMDIKTIYHNKEKGTTCVMFKDGKRVIVKRSKGEKDSVYTAVAYAITKMLYKSNTAFTKEVDKKSKK